MERKHAASTRLGKKDISNTSALPIAYVVPEVHLTVGPTGGEQFLPVGYDPRREVAMSVDPLPPGPRPVPGGEVDRDVGGSRSGSCRAASRDRAPGPLVVANTWMPGWSAVVDGVAAPVLRGNHCQQVVPLRSAGDHRIDLRYEAPGLARGMAVSGLALLGWGFVGLLAWWRGGWFRDDQGMRE